MPLDGVTLSLLCREMRGAVGGRVERIYQPSRDTVLLHLRGEERAALLISARQGEARAQFTELSYGNPDTPPMFCMLLRKYLTGARVTGIEARDFERVLYITAERYNDLGDLVRYTLVAELFGSHGNIILTGDDGRIIDAVRRSDLEAGGRIIQPGAVYSPPEPVPGFSILTDAGNLADAMIATGLPGDEAARRTLRGVSPLVAREVAHRALPGGGPFGERHRERLIETLNLLRETYEAGGEPCLLTRGGAARDFSWFPVTQYGEGTELLREPTFSALLDRFYKEKTEAALLAERAGDLSRTVRAASARAEKKLAARREDLTRCEGREKYLLYGQLLKSNPGKAETGDTAVRLTDWYSPDMREVTVPLRPELSQGQNAERYFREYRKRTAAAGMLGGLIDDAAEELEYLRSVEDSLSHARTPEDFSEIRQELAEAGYIRRQPGQRRKPAAPKSPRFTSPGGFSVSVGRNNTQNDWLTFHAGKDDYWLHAKNVPGSHVILYAGGKEPAEEDLIFAASLAARYSKAGRGDNVPVDITKARYVKKPAGARPGFVTFRNQTTVYVTPWSGEERD